MLLQEVSHTRPFGGLGLRPLTMRAFGMPQQWTFCRATERPDFPDPDLPKLEVGSIRQDIAQRKRRAKRLVRRRQLFGLLQLHWLAVVAEVAAAGLGDQH